MRRILFVNASISCVSWIVRIMVNLKFLLISRIILRTATFETASSPMVGSSERGFAASEGGRQQVRTAFAAQGKAGGPASL